MGQHLSSLKVCGQERQESGPQLARARGHTGAHWPPGLRAGQAHSRTEANRKVASHARSYVPLVLEPGSQPWPLATPPPHAAPQVCKGLAPGPVLRESDSTELEGGDCGLVHLPGDRHGSRLRTTVSARCPARRVTRGLSQQLHGLENVTSQVRLGRWLRGHLVTRQIQVCQCEWTRGLESPPSPRVQVLPSLDSTQMVALVTPARPCSCRPALPSQAAAVACGVPPVTLKDCCPLSRGGVGVSHEQHRQQSLCTYSLPKQIEFILCKICGHF